MQAFGNIATDPVLKVSKKTNKGYWEFRLCENQRGLTQDPTWYTVRLMSPDNPGLTRGAFVRATGRLKADAYSDRNGKPASALLILAFEAVQLVSVTELKAAREAKQQEDKKDAVPG